MAFADSPTDSRPTVSQSLARLTYYVLAVYSATSMGNCFCKPPPRVRPRFRALALATRSSVGRGFFFWSWLFFFQRAVVRVRSDGASSPHSAPRGNRDSSTPIVYSPKSSNTPRSRTRRSVRFPSKVVISVALFSLTLDEKSLAF